MDELFDRIKAIKIKRRYLVTSLIATEILGILVLIWFLKTPLSQKFLFTAPKTFIISEMNTEKRYLVSQGDFIRGQTSPETKIVVLISEENQIQLKSKVVVDAQNIWNFQIPQNLNPGIKILTIAELDKKNLPNFLTNYRIRVKSNSLFPFFYPKSNTNSETELMDLSQMTNILGGAKIQTKPAEPNPVAESTPDLDKN